MSARLDITVGVRTIGGGLEAVGCKVGDRVAGTLVVEAGHGEPLAALLSSGAIVEAAIAMVTAASTRGADVAAALHHLERAIAESELVDPEAQPILQDIPKAPHVRRLQYAHPADQIVEAKNRLFFGNPEGEGGDSAWRAVAVAGVVLAAEPGGPAPRALGTFEGGKNALECWRPLSAKLREMADGIDAQYVAAELDRAARVKDEASR